MGVALAAFHLQSTKFNHIRPATPGEYPDLTTTLRERGHMDKTTLESLHKLLEEDSPNNYLHKCFQNCFIF
eukprot:5414165-Ditylum_brightwellii.AAC.1